MTDRQQLEKEIYNLKKLLIEKEQELELLLIQSYSKKHEIFLHDHVLIDGHRGMISGFNVVNGEVKPQVTRFKKDKKTGEYNFHSWYSAALTVQPHHKLKKI